MLIKCRQAADRVGATMMDRPEWVTVHPTTGEVYVTLTNNSRRGNTPVSSNMPDGSSIAASANPPVDAANPRPDNDFGHIIRWRETGGNVAATRPSTGTSSCSAATRPPPRPWAAATRRASTAARPWATRATSTATTMARRTELWFDKDGRLWIETDQGGDATGDWANIGGNMLLCADVATGETRRFLTSVPKSEVTGVITTPDGRTMFVGIQHPGEDWSGSFTAKSTWPDSGVNGPTTFKGSSVQKPRSSVVVITKNDGGVIGT